MRGIIITTGEDDKLSPVVTASFIFGWDFIIPLDAAVAGSIVVGIRYEFGLTDIKRVDRNGTFRDQGFAMSAGLMF